MDNDIMDYFDFLEEAVYSDDEYFLKMLRLQKDAD